MSHRERVLVVDDVSDTADVLRAVLEPRGLSINRIGRLGRPGGATDSAPPAVIVLDAETLDGAAPLELSRWGRVPQVIIGTVRPGGSAQRPSDDAGRRYLQKPFQFAELIQAIESLIAQGLGNENSAAPSSNFE
ncbi:MAG TPA: response regulator [Planctomycetaceae bacterium]|nr:response regulator [Planctomycetaceae bacterium]